MEEDRWLQELIVLRNGSKGNEEQYAIIGGTACDILMTEEGLDFRATKDIDLVLIIEALDANFGKKFWEIELFTRKLDAI